MTNPTTEADSQTRTIRGVVDSVDRLAPMRVGDPMRYLTEIEEPPLQNWTLILDHPLVVGQTYEVEVTVREVE